MESLKRPEIIRKKREFDRLFSQGYRSQSKNLRVLWCRSPKRKVGFIVSKRLGIAVERNRMRRLLREAYRRNKSGFSTQIELLVIARPEARGLEYSSVKRELLLLIRRAGLMDDEDDCYLAD